MNFVQQENYMSIGKIGRRASQIDEAVNAPWMAPALGGQLDGLAVKIIFCCG